MPQRFVDVNVHPTKESVEFLNERAIIERIGQELKDKLDATHKSKSHGVSMEITKTVQPLQLEEPKKVLKPNAGPKRSNVSLDSVKALRTKLDENNSPELQVTIENNGAKINITMGQNRVFRKCFPLTPTLEATGQKMLFLFNIPQSCA
jgi:DNA mismatch repair ATPase MutL